MKKIYLIQYNSPNEIIEKRLKSLGDWVKYFSDNWLVSSEKNSEEIYELLTDGLDKQSIIIIEIKPTNYYGRMNVKVWDFMKKYRTQNKNNK